MKTLIIFLLTATIAFSQTREPEQHTFYMDSIPFLLDTQNDYFKLNDFQLGFHWGSMKKLSNALLMNQADITTQPTSEPFHPSGSLNDSTNYFVRAYYDTVINGQPFEGHLYTHTYYDNHIVFTNGITYDPSLYVNPSNPFELNIREGDPQNPVFGFMNKKGRIINEQFNENYSRLILEDSLTNEVVLSEPWPPNELTFYSYLQHLKK
jgi:hypothetical protein